MSSSSTMRSLVRSVISEVPGNQDSGSHHFGDETIQTFFAEVKGLVNAAFGALNDEVKSVPGKSEGWRERAMERGLTFMADRSNEGAIINSVVESDDACRSLTNLYFSSMNRFVQSRASKQELMNINFVPFGKFIASLYRQLANDTHMKTTFFKSMSYAEKDAFLADTLRRVMQKSIIWPAASSSKASVATTVKPAPESYFFKPLTPSDSVSNISKPAAVPSVPPTASVVVGQSVAAKVVKAAVDGEDGLSPETLQKHNKGGSSRFSAFRQASVVGDKQRDTKVITLSRMDKHSPSQNKSVANSHFSARSQMTSQGDEANL
jgi:hypothetical protein